VHYFASFVATDLITQTQQTSAHIQQILKNAFWGTWPNLNRLWMVKQK